MHKPGATLGAYLLCVKSLQELLEVGIRVVGPGGGLRVVLYGKNRPVAMPDAFDRAIIEVKVSHLERSRAGHARRVATHGETMVLGRDKYLSRREIANRMVAAPMAVGQLDGLPSQGEPKQLVTEADAENR